MKLTLWRRLMLCMEILTATSSHSHPTFEKDLPLFQRGYGAGQKDAKYADTTASRVDCA